MGALRRRGLLAGALSLPAMVARAQPGGPTRRMRVSVPLARLPQFLPAFRRFAASRPDLLFETLARDDDNGLMPSGITASIQGGRPHPDAALTDARGLAWGSTRGAWRPLPATLREAGEAAAGRLAAVMRPLMGQEALLVSADPGGPLLLHRSSVLAHPPRSAAALLDYARENRGRFLYSRPSESALSQQFLMALPHLLGDQNPADAQTGWSRSWAWLEELDRHVSFYPSDDAAAFDEFSMAGIDLFPATLTAFLRGRMDGLLPEDSSFAGFEAGPLVPQGVFLTMPQQTGDDRLPLVEAFARFLLSPGTQSGLFGRDLLPGEAGFGLDQAAPLSEAERPAWRAALPAAAAAEVAAMPLAAPLGPYQLAFMLNRWDESIGARHGERR